MTEKYALNDEQLAAALGDLPHWEVKDGKLTSEYKFPTFLNAVNWMMAVSIEAEQLDHHPEWTNVYSRVNVSLVTHDLGNVISSYDIELARKMDALTNEFGLER